MSAVVTIMDDPGHPEGGHALIHVTSAAPAPATDTLTIEILTEGFDYRGPRRIETSPRQTQGGFHIPLGPDVVGALRQGIAVNLRLDDGSLNADVLWPALTPPRAAARRPALSNTKPKRLVVSGVDTPRVAPPIAPHNAKRIAVEPVEPPPEPPPEPPRVPAPPVILVPPPLPVTEPVVEPKPPAPIIVTPVSDGPKDGTAGPATTTKPDVVAAAFWSTPRVAGVGVIAFLLGLGSFAVIHAMTAAPTPTPLQPIEAKADLDLASPYELLNNLPTRSPAGVIVKANDSDSFRYRAQTAASASEADFWRLWALHAALESRTNNFAAVLGNFATVMANAHRDEGDIAAARVVWELAAIGKDCNAMDNLAATYGLDSKDTGTAAVQKLERTKAVGSWHQRADACREHATQKR